MAPRVIVHAGFHKTGTTSAQQFLRANGKHIYPRCALVLPGKLRRGASRLAVRYSRFGTDDLLEQFGATLHDTLSAIAPRDRCILISDEGLAGRMPGRDGQAGYMATPDLMKRIERVIHAVFGADAEVIFYFSIRAPDAWLRSTYKHNLRASRLTMDMSDYDAAYGSAADLAGVARAVSKVVEGTVQVCDLAELNGPNGPAQPLIDLIRLPSHLRKRLAPHPLRNAGPPEDLIDDLLALNRSTLSDGALTLAKDALLGKATDHDG